MRIQEGTTRLGSVAPGTIVSYRSTYYLVAGAFEPGGHKVTVADMGNGMIYHYSPEQLVSVFPDAVLLPEGGVEEADEG